MKAFFQALAVFVVLGIVMIACKKEKLVEPAPVAPQYVRVVIDNDNGTSDVSNIVRPIKGSGY